MENAKIGIFLMIIGVTILVIMSLGYWLFHPEITEMQLFLENWEFYLVGVGCYAEGQYLYLRKKP